MQFPITYFERNLIIDRDRQAWAVYNLKPWHYEHLGLNVRLGMLWRLSRLFWEMQDTQGQLLMIPRAMRASDYLSEVQHQSNNPLSHIAEKYCGQMGTGMSSSSEGVGYEYYLVLLLPRAEAGLGGMRSYLNSFWQEPMRWTDEFMGMKAPYLLDYEFEEYLVREEALFERLNHVCKAARVDEQQITWLIRRSFWRGIEEPPARAGWRPDALAVKRTDGVVELQPLQSELATLTEGEMNLNNPRRVALTQITEAGEVTGYTSFAYVSELPDEMSFPGCEWLFGLQDLPFPVEVCLRWEALPYEQALAMVRRKHLEIGDQGEHTRKSGEETPIALLMAQEQVTQLEHDLKERRFPTILSSVGTAVSARDPKELLERVRRLRSHFSAFQIGLEVPAGDQLTAFVEYLPGGKRRLKDYIHRVPPEVLAASMFLGTHALGDKSGPYIGWTGVLRRPVYLDPSLPPQLNRSASIAFLGSLGGGKSFAANLLTYLSVVFSGAQALVLDPKGERGHWLRDLPELEGYLRVITLGPGDEDTGRLDPFILSKGLDDEGMKETGNLAVSLLSFLGNIPMGDPRFLALMAAVEDVARNPEPALNNVVDRLEALGEQDRTVAELARYYRALSRRAYANLIFGNGQEEGLDLRDRLNVLQLQQLIMPPSGKPRQEYSLEELLSVALMHAVTAFATQFTRRNRGTFKIVLLDEAWALLASSQGRSLVTHLLRTGRALNNAVYLISQNVADLLDETLRNNVGMKMVFRSQDQTEILKELQFLNLEADDENMTTIRQLETGQALFQDIEGRAGVITLNPIFPHLTKAFDTRPVNGKKEAVS